MSFRGSNGDRGSGGRRGCGRGRKGRGGRERGEKRDDGGLDNGAPEEIIPFGYYAYPTLDDLICKAQIRDVPHFDAVIYLENKEAVGQIDEIFGNLLDYSVSIKLNENIKVTSFMANQRLYIDPKKLLPIEQFLPPPSGTTVEKKPRSRRRWGRDRKGRQEEEVAAATI